MRRDVFHAIADPHRRAILGLLAEQPRTLNGLAEQFTISRPAVSKHVKVLSECGLIEVRRKGRERYCRARFDKLTPVADWVEQYRRFWEERLDALDAYLQQLQSAAPDAPAAAPVAPAKPDRKRRR